MNESNGTLSELAQLLRRICEATGRNQSQLARDLSVSRQAVSQWLLDQSLPSAERLWAIFARAQLSQRAADTGLLSDIRRILDSPARDVTPFFEAVGTSLGAYLLAERRRVAFGRISVMHYESQDELLSALNVMTRLLRKAQAAGKPSPSITKMMEAICERDPSEFSQLVDTTADFIRKSPSKKQPLARDLTAHRSRVVVLPGEFHDRPYILELSKAVAAEMARAHVEDVTPKDRIPFDAVQALAWLEANADCYDTVLWFPAMQQPLRWLDFAARHMKRTVFVDENPMTRGMDFENSSSVLPRWLHVGSDTCNGIEQISAFLLRVLTTRLRKPDVCRAWIINGDVQQRRGQLLNRELEHALGELGCGLELRSSTALEFSEAHARAEVSRTLTKDSPPHVIFCANDELALGAAEAVKSARIESTLVIGWDGQQKVITSIQNGTSPICATIRQSSSSVAIAAVETAALPDVSWFGQESRCKELLVPVELIHNTKKGAGRLATLEEFVA